MSDQTKRSAPAKRATIVDVARASGVSLSAASYALNGKPGVSEATRAEVLRVAGELGWSPNHSARALQGQRTHVIGLVFAGDSPGERSLSDYMMRFLNGINTELAASGRAVLMTTVDTTEKELEVYRSWAGERRVDGFVITNVRHDDPRPELVKQLQVPAVIAGDVRGRSALPSIWTDDVEAMQLNLEHLLGKGHRRIIRFSGNPGYLHDVRRAEAFSGYLAARRLRSDGNLTVADGRAAAVAQLTGLMASAEPPSAIICDSADRACQTLLTLSELGYRVPHDVALTAWDDAAVCEITSPTLTALARDAFDYGVVVAQQLVLRITGDAIGDRRGTVSELITRESS